MAKIKDIYIDNRPREKAIGKGIDSLSIVEVLALIIGSGVKNFSSIDIANELLVRFKNVRNLLNCNLKDLKDIKGLNNATALKLLAAFNLNKRYTEDCNKSLTIKNYNPKTIVQYFQTNISESDDESYLIFGFKDKKYVKIFKNNNLNIKHISISLQQLIKEFKEFEINQIILIHNHLEKDVYPSNDDIFSSYEMFRQLKENDIKLIDHIITNRNDYFSFYKFKLLN